MLFTLTLGQACEVDESTLTPHLGCRDVTDLLQTLTRLEPRSAARLQTIFDAHLSPAVVFDGPIAADDHPLPARDDRTRAQKQHDALAAARGVAASSGLLPTIGVHAPTLVVSVDAGDLVAGTGFAHAQGRDQPVSTTVARRVACAGIIQRVGSRADGRIVAIGTEERVFNRHQRRAIALRDGGCIIPGYGVPAGWCEIHQVTEHARGGPTRTDNGVLLGPRGEGHRAPRRGVWGSRGDAGTTTASSTASAGSCA